MLYSAGRLPEVVEPEAIAPMDEDHGVLRRIVVQHSNLRNHESPRQTKPSPVGIVRLGVVQRSLVEEYELTGLELNIDPARQINVRCVGHLREDSTWCGWDVGDYASMGSRGELKATVFGSRRIDGQPCSDNDARFERPEVPVLMPGNLAATCLFVEEVAAPEE